MTPVPLSTLRTGRRFTLPCSGKVGKLLRLYNGSALVELGAPRRREFTTADGKRVTFTKRERTHISRGTMVLPGVPTCG